MRVRTLQQTTERYVKGSVEGFLEGQRDLKWISGVLLRSGLPKQPTLQVVLPLMTYGDPARAASLSSWLENSNW
jgi:hypothetical protein